MAKAYDLDRRSAIYAANPLRADGGLNSSYWEINPNDTMTTDEAMAHQEAKERQAQEPNPAIGWLGNNGNTAADYGYDPEGGDDSITFNKNRPGISSLLGGVGMLAAAPVAGGAAAAGLVAGASVMDDPGDFSRKVFNAIPDHSDIAHSALAEAFQTSDDITAEKIRIANVLGLNPDYVTTANREDYQSFARAAEQIEKLSVLKKYQKPDGGIDFDRLYREIPGLAEVQRTKGNAAAALLLANPEVIKSIKDVYSGSFGRIMGSIAAGWNRGTAQRAINLIYADMEREGRREPTAAEAKRLKDLNEWLKAQPKNSYSGYADTLGGVLGSAAENLPMMGASQIAGGIVGGLTLLATKKPAWAKWAYNLAATSEMAYEISGNQYQENAQAINANGEYKYTTGQAASLSAAQGLAEAVLEQWTIRDMLGAVFGRSKSVGDLVSIYKQHGFTEEGKALAKATAKEKIMEYAKVSGVSMGSELREEFLQSIADNAIENVWQAGINGRNGEYTSFNDMLAEGVGAAIEAVPAVIGFGIAGSVMHGAANTRPILEGVRGNLENYIRKSIARDYLESNIRESVAQKSVETAQHNELIADMQVAVKDSEKIPEDVLTAALDAENEKRGIADSEVDISSLAKEEGGAEIVSMLCQAAGIPEETKQRLLTMQTPATVKTSVLMQMGALSPEQQEKLNNHTAPVNGYTPAMLANERQAMQLKIEAIRKAGANKVNNAVERIMSHEAMAGLTDGQKELAREVVTGGFGNPLKMVDLRMKEARKTIRTILRPIIDGLKAEGGQGTVVIPKEVGSDLFLEGGIRVSENAPWYQQFYKDNGRAPSAFDLQQIATAYVIPEVDSKYLPYEIARLSPDQYDAVEADILRKALAEQKDLEEIKTRLEKIDPGTLTMSDILSEDGQKVFNYFIKAHGNGNRDVQRAASVDALLGALMYQRLKEYYDKLGKEYSAEDFILRTQVEAGGALISADDIQVQNGGDLVVKGLKVHPDFVEGNRITGNVKGLLDKIVGILDSEEPQNAMALRSFVPADIAGDFLKAMQENDIERAKKIVSDKAAAMEADQKFNQEVVSQSEVVRKQYEGTDQWLKAPNGEDTNLTEEQWLAVRTPAFKNWFGDWENDPENASKVIDENGEPLVVYHGTDAEFDVFDASKARANMDIQGNFFSPWKDDAQGYGENVRAFFLNIKNPAASHVGYKALKTYQGQDGAGIKAREDLKKHGFDGVNNDDEEYIAFESTQIKSATDNNGNFSSTNNSVYYQNKTGDEAGFIYKAGELYKIVEAKYPTIEQEGVGNIVREAIQTTLDFGEGAGEVFVSDGKSMRRTKTRDNRRKGFNPRLQQQNETKLNKRGKFLGLGITRALVNDGAVSLVGNTIHNEKDLAEIAQVLRHPGYEKFHYVYVNDSGDIVNHETVSAMLPGVSPIYTKEQYKDPNGLWNGIAKHQMEVMRATDSTGFYIIHNHPSGDPSPSKMDMRITRTFAQNPAFKGHIIIDHTKYTYVDKNNTPKEFTINPTVLFSYDVPSIDHKLLGNEISNDDSFAKAASIAAKEAETVAFFVDSKLKIRAVQKIHDNFKEKPSEAKLRYLRYCARVCGGRSVFFATSNEGVFQDLCNLRSENENQGIYDVVLMDDTTRKHIIKNAGFIAEGNAWFGSSKEDVIRNPVRLLQKNDNVKGSTITQANGQHIIQLFEGADESTFLHEMSHIYLDELKQLAEMAPESDAGKDYATIMAWASYKEGASAEYAGTATASEFAGREAEIRQAMRDGFIERKVDGTTVTVTKDQLLAEWAQERFARGFEAYLQSGEAPTSALKKAFRNLKKWLNKIYKAVTGNGKVAAQPSEDVKHIMDRMLASEEQIELAAAEMLLNSTDDEIAEKLQAKDLQDKLLAEAKAEAEERMLKKLLKQNIKKAKEDYIAKRREELREELYDDNRCYQAELMVENMDEQAAMEICGYESVEEWKAELADAMGSLEAGVKFYLDGELEQLDEAFLNVEQLREQAKQELASTEVMAELVNLQKEIYARLELKSKQKPRQAARLRKMRDAFKGKIKALKGEFKVQRREQQREARLNSISKARRQAEWLRGIRDALKGKVKVQRQAAREIMSSLPIREATSSFTFWRKMENSDRAALKAIAKAIHKSNEEEVQKAVYAKEEQGRYIALYRESLKVRATVDKLLRKINKRIKAVTKKDSHVGPEYRYFFDKLMFAYGFIETAPIVPSTLEGVSFKDFIDSQYNELDGDAPTKLADLIPKEIIAAIDEAVDDKPRKNRYKDLTIDQLATVDNVANIIKHWGVNSNRRLTDGKSFDEIAGELYTSAMEHCDVKTMDDKVNPIKGTLGWYISYILNPETILNILGGKGGKWIHHIYNILFDATEQERILKEQTNNQMTKLVTACYGKGWNKYKIQRKWKDKIPTAKLTTGAILTKEQIICMALNWGNADNRKKLCDGFNMAEDSVKAILDNHMEERDWRFVQGVWNILEGLGDKVSLVTEKEYGLPMQRVKADAFAVGDMTLAGGYYPIAYRRDGNPRADAKQELEEQKSLTGALALGTGMGQTKSRTSSVPIAPLRLELAVLDKHINQSCHIATMRLACRDAFKTLNQSGVAQAIVDIFGDEVYRMLKQWVTDCWAEPPGAKGIERLAGKLRARTVSAIMAYRLATALLNWANIFPMIDVLGAKGTLEAFLMCARHPMIAKRFVLTDSAWMRDRANNLDRDLSKVSDNLFDPDNPALHGINKYANWLLEVTDMLTSVPAYYYTYKTTFNAEIEKGTEAEEAHRIAHRKAHENVRSIVGSADTVDMAAVARKKSEFYRAITPFYSFANTMGNAVYGKALAGYYKGGKATFAERYGDFIKSFVLRYLLMSLMETAIKAGIDALTAGDGDKDENSFLLEWARNSVSSATGAFYGANLLIAMGVNYMTGETSTNRSSSVLGSAVNRAGDVLRNLPELYEGKIDFIDFGRSLSKAGTAYFGFSDTIADSLWNSLRFIEDDYRFDNMDDLREYIAKTLFDRKLKKKG